MTEILHDPLKMYYAFALLVVFPVLRILKRASLAPFWAALLALPLVGFTACAGVLALSKWKEERA
jgi:hypothetical protein